MYLNSFEVVHNSISLSGRLIQLSFISLSGFLHPSPIQSPWYFMPLLVSCLPVCLHWSTMTMTTYLILCWFLFRCQNSPQLMRWTLEADTKMAAAVSWSPERCKVGPSWIRLLHPSPPHIDWIRRPSQHLQLIVLLEPPWTISTWFRGALSCCSRPQPSVNIVYIEKGEHAQCILTLFWQNQHQLL